MTLTEQQYEALSNFAARLTAATVMAGTKDDFELCCANCGLGELKNLIWQIVDDVKDPRGELQNCRKSQLAPWQRKPAYLNHMLVSIIPNRISRDDNEHAEQIERLEAYLDYGMLMHPDIRDAICREHQGNLEDIRPRQAPYLHKPNMNLTFDMALEASKTYFNHPGRQNYIATGESNLTEILTTGETTILLPYGIFTQEDLCDTVLDYLVQSDIPASLKTSIIGKIYSAIHEKLTGN